MRSPHLATAVTAVLLASLVGCAPLDEEVVPESPPQPAEPAPEPEPEPSEEEGAASKINLVACDEVELEAVSLVITQQTEAFGERDFDTAYSMASPSFRESVPLEAFQQLIDSSYGPLIQSTNLNFDDCLVERDRDFATIDVRFSQGGQDVFGLQYVVTNTEEGWRVNGASNLEVVGAGA